MLEKLQGLWNDTGGVFQKQNGRAVLWETSSTGAGERTELLM